MIICTKIDCIKIPQKIVKSNKYNLKYYITKEEKDDKKHNMKPLVKLTEISDIVKCPLLCLVLIQPRYNQVWTYKYLNWRLPHSENENFF